MARYSFYIDYKDGNGFVEVELFENSLAIVVERTADYMDGMAYEVKLEGSCKLFMDSVNRPLIEAQYSIGFLVNDITASGYRQAWKGEVLVRTSYDNNSSFLSLANFVSSDESNVYHRMLDVLDEDIPLRKMKPENEVRLVQGTSVFPRFGGIMMVGDTPSSGHGIDGMLSYLNNQVFLQRDQFPIPDGEWFMMNTKALIIDEFNDQEANDPALFGLDETVTFKDLFRWIADTWNLYWYQDFAELRFAHPWDAVFMGTVIDRVAETEHLQRYTFVTPEVISKELTKFNNEVDVDWFPACEEFTGMPIEYPLDTKDILEHDMSDKLTMNVWPVGVSFDGSTIVFDLTKNYDGFSFLHAQLESGETYYNVVSTSGQYGHTDIVNGSFAKSNLHHNYFRDYSVYPKNFKVNGIDVVAEHEKPVRQLPEYKEATARTPLELGTIKWAGGFLARVNRVSTTLKDGVATYKCTIFKTDQAW